MNAFPSLLQSAEDERRPLLSKWSEPMILRRTFEARNHPKDSAERARLNCDVLTSEYMPSQRYLLRKLFLMSDGTQHPTQKFNDATFRTKSEAVNKTLNESATPTI